MCETHIAELTLQPPWTLRGLFVSLQFVRHWSKPTCVSGAQPVLHGDAEGEDETHPVRPAGEDLPPADTAAGGGHRRRWDTAFLLYLHLFILFSPQPAPKPGQVHTGPPTQSLPSQKGSWKIKKKTNRGAGKAEVAHSSTQTLVEVQWVDSPGRGLSSFLHARPHLTRAPRSSTQCCTHTFTHGPTLHTPLTPQAFHTTTTRCRKERQAAVYATASCLLFCIIITLNSEVTILHVGGFYEGNLATWHGPVQLQCVILFTSKKQ